MFCCCEKIVLICHFEKKNISVESPYPFLLQKAVTLMESDQYIGMYDYAYMDILVYVCLCIYGHTCVCACVCENVSFWWNKPEPEQPLQLPKSQKPLETNLTAML